MPTIQFAPFSSTVSPAFWHALVKIKLDVLKLDQGEIPIVASYAAGRTITDRETGAGIALPSSVTLDENAFSPAASVHTPPGSSLTSGKFKNFNTIEDFKNADKSALFNQLADEVRLRWPSPQVVENPHPTYQYGQRYRCGPPSRTKTQILLKSCRNFS